MIDITKDCVFTVMKDHEDSERFYLAIIYIHEKLDKLEIGYVMEDGFMKMQYTGYEFDGNHLGDFRILYHD